VNCSRIICPLVQANFVAFRSGSSTGLPQVSPKLSKYRAFLSNHLRDGRLSEEGLRPTKFDENQPELIYGSARSGQIEIPVDKLRP
jgi:hypothetical protein